MSDTPGVGSYQQMQRPTSANVRIGTGKARGDVFGLEGKNEMPGPGDYQSPDPRPKNVATMQGKHEEKMNTLPGPGQYNQDDSVIKKSSASIRMTS